MVILKSVVDWEDWGWAIRNRLNKKELGDAISDDVRVREAVTVKDRKIASAHIGETLDRSLVASVRHVASDDPWGLIDALRTKFFRSTAANVTTMRRELALLSMSESDTVESVQHRIEFYAANIEAQSQEKVGDNQKACVLLNALPASYDDLRATINTQTACGAHKLTYEWVLESALAHETNVITARARAAKAGEEHVLQAAGGVQRKPLSGGKRPFLGKCNKCGTKGHKGFECKKAAQTPGTSGVRVAVGMKKEGLCHSCGGRGHWQNECPTYKREQQRGASGGTETAYVSMGHKHMSYILDTGATSHIVSDRSLLSTSQEKKQQVTILGGTTVTSTAVGTLRSFPGQALVVPEAREG